MLGVQTTSAAILIRGNPDVLEPTTARRAPTLPAAALELRALVADNPGQSRLRREIRGDALAYVDDYADPVIARTREAGVGAGRALRRRLHDGGARADELRGADRPARRASRRRSPTQRARRRPTPRRTGRC